MGIEVSILFSVAIVNSALSLFVLLSNRTRTTLIYSLFVLSISLWAIFLAFFMLETDLERAIQFANLYYIAAAAIPVFFLYFALLFPERQNNFELRYLWLFLPFILITGSLLVDKNLIVLGFFEAHWGKDVFLNDKPYLLYSLYFSSFVLYAYYRLLLSYRKVKDQNERIQLKFVIYGTVVGFALGMIFNLILPFTSTYQFIWLGPVFTLIMVISVGYAVARHHLFDTKVITTEVLTFSLWIFITVRILLAETLREQLLDVGLLLVTVIVGIFLIKSVIKEVKSREEISQLARNLKKANDKLKEIDQKKSEFISIATHQIRGPLAAIKGYASLMLEDSFGAITNQKQKEAVERIFNSSSALVLIVNDFLDISRIDLGRLKYACVNTDLRDIAKTVVEEMSSSVKQAGLTVTLTDDNKGPYIINADVGKMQQVVGNLLDNAVKYTKEGSIEVKVMKKGNRIQVAISDTGMGMSKETIPILFEKFSRAENASTANVMGSGLGLYVVRQLVEDHRGRVWAESEGEGKGSRFIAEFPALAK